jgi:bifunctional isochorismate lyase/aryl carrier protein
MALPSIAAYALPSAADLPAPRVSWPIDATRAALLVHDMQRYFVEAFAAHVDPIAGVLARIGRIRDAADACGIPVFYTAQPVRQDPRERGLQADFWGAGMQLDPDHCAIVAPLAPRPHDTILTKWRYSAFQRSDFAERLQAAGRDQLIVTGVFGHIGCLATTFEAFVRDIRPFYVADAVADFTRQHHDMALAVAAGCSARVLTTEDLIVSLAPPAAPGPLKLP